MKVIPINPGYFNCKSINGQIFKSRVSKLNFNVFVTEDTLVYNGEKYVVGEGDVNLDTDKTENDFLKILVLNMLARFVRRGSQEFDIAITTPPLLYQQQKEVLPKYLQGTYEIVHNEVPKRITIKKVAVFPETITAYFANIDQLEDPLGKTLIIDIGGLTTNGIMVENGVFAQHGIFTIESGTYHLDYKISQYLNGKYLLTTTFNDINNYRKKGMSIQGGNYDIFTLEKENIEAFYEEHIKKILQQCKLKNWDTNTCSVLITGGGGLVLFDTIKNKFLKQAKLSKNPIFDNLNGLKILAEQVFSNDNTN